MTINISIMSVLERVYAISALHSVTSGTPGVKEILGEDHEAALRQGLKGAFVELLMHLGPVVADSNLSELDAEETSLRLECDCEWPLPMPAVRGIMEETLVLLTLAAATGDEACRRSARGYLRSLALHDPVTITPCAI